MALVDYYSNLFILNVQNKFNTIIIQGTSGILPKCKINGIIKCIAKLILIISPCYFSSCPWDVLFYFLTPFILSDSLDVFILLKLALKYI